MHEGAVSRVHDAPSACRHSRSHAAIHERVRALSVFRDPLALRLAYPAATRRPKRRGTLDTTTGQRTSLVGFPLIYQEHNA